MNTKTDSESNNSINAQRARRAVGAMFFSFFGGAWIGYWGYQTFGNKVFSVAIVIATTLALVGFAYSRYRLFQPSLAAESQSPAQQKADRIFNIVNVVQWLIILIAGNVLANIGLSQWVIPMAMCIIGIHFFPLAYVFANQFHLMTGSGLIVLSIVYPFLAAGGPSDPIGCLGAGIILWTSALWALWVDPSVASKVIEETAVREID